MLEHFAGRVHRTHVIIALKTLNLAEQVHRNLSALGVGDQTKTLQSGDGYGVASALADAINADTPPRIVLVTHAALLELGWVLESNSSLRVNLGRYHVVVDEVPEPFLSSECQIKVKTNHLWYEYLQKQEPAAGTTLPRLEVRDEARLRSFLAEKGNATSEHKQVIRAILAGYPAYERTVGDQGWKISVVYLSPLFAVLRSCGAFFLMASNVDTSPFVVTAKHLFDVGSVRPAHMQPKERSGQSTTRRITLHAAYTERASIARFNGKEAEFKQLCDAVAERLKRDFIYTTNENKNSNGIKCRFKSIAAETFEGAGHWVSQQSHGMNLFGGSGVHKLTEHEIVQRVGDSDIQLYMRGFTKAAWLATNRPSPMIGRNIERLCQQILGDDKGVEAGKEILAAMETFMSFEAAYQFISRTLLRNQHDVSGLEFVLMDRPTLEYIQKTYLQDAIIGDIGFCERPNGKREDNTEKTASAVAACKEAKMTQRKAVEVTGLSLSTVRRYWRVDSVSA